MSPLPRRTITATLAIAALGLAGAAPGALARNGADDPAGHRAGDDHGAHHSSTHRSDDRRSSHRRHNRRHDDGPNHR